MKNTPHELRRAATLATQAHAFHVAVSCLTRATLVDPANVVYLVELGDALTNAGRHAEAIGAYQRALEMTPGDPERYVAVGQSLAHQYRFDEALPICEMALRLEASHASPPTRAHRLMGDVLYGLGRTASAIERYETCVRLEPRDAIAYLRLGAIHLERGEFQLAESCFRRGLDVNADAAAEANAADLHAGLGQALIGLGSPDAAVRAFRAALSIAPRHVDACEQLVLAFEAMGKKGDAASAWLSLGWALEGQARAADAVDAYRQALARDPDSLQAQMRLGAVQLSLGRPRETIQSCERVLAINPEHQSAHFMLAKACHAAGDADRAWREFGWICPPHDMKRRSFEQPVWDGGPLDGRTLLIWTRETSGLGDAIQFLRFVHVVKARGARVVVECHKKLLPLVEQMRGVDDAVARDVPLPPFDVHAPLPLIPVILRQGRRPLPANVPYLSVDPRLTDIWRRRLGAHDGPTIGLCWGGLIRRPDAGMRFMPLAAFAPLAPLACLRNIRFVSLQVGLQVHELLTPPPGLHLQQFLDESSALTDTAALIQNLDLVISVDTMIAHLAGALGKPVWTLLAKVTDWRWKEGDDTPWYPTMRLFRQRHERDWPGVVERVCGALGAGAVDKTFQQVLRTT